jgi:SAM-dependent methyltransferase
VSDKFIPNLLAPFFRNDAENGKSNIGHAMMNSVHALDSRFYPHYADHWDDRIFREVILRHIRKDSLDLDLGAGSGFVEQMNFRGTAGKVCGLDPGASVLGNPHLDEAKVGSGEAIPWPEQTFDVVFADNVLDT